MKAKTSKPKPTKITWQELAFWYLRAEMSKMLPQNQSAIDKFLQSIDDDHLNRLLFGLSKIYRANKMHTFITNDKLNWQIKRISVEDINIGGFHNWEISKILTKPEVSKKLSKLHTYLKSNKKLATKYKELITKQKFNADERLFAIQAGNGIYVIDGGHRLLNMILNNVEQVDFYVCNVEALNKNQGKSIIPSSLFYWLKIILLNKNTAQHKSVLKLLDIINQDYKDEFNGLDRYFLEEIGPEEEEFKSKVHKLLKVKNEK